MVHKVHPIAQAAFSAINAAYSVGCLPLATERKENLIIAFPGQHLEALEQVDQNLVNIISAMTRIQPFVRVCVFYHSIIGSLIYEVFMMLILHVFSKSSAVRRRNTSKMLLSTCGN